MRFGGPCCCGGCLYFSDDFTRVDYLGSELDPDGVNILGSDRWEFTPGDWHIQVGKLKCDTAGSEILFYNNPTGPNKRFIIEAEARLFDVGDYVSIVYGTDEIVFTKLDAGMVNVTGGPISKDMLMPVNPGNIYAFKIGIAVLKPSDYPDEVELDHNKIMISMGGFNYGSECLTFDIDENGYKKYGFKGSVGITLDNLVVTMSKDDCGGYTSKSCNDVCSPDAIPDSIALSISGIYDSHTVCNNDVAAYEAAIATADSDWEAALISCDSVWPDHDDPGYISCRCTAGGNRYTAYCSAYDTYTDCVVYCPGGSLDGGFVLDKIDSEDCISCTYELEVTVADYYPTGFEGRKVAEPLDFDPLTSCDTGIITTDTVFLRAHLHITYYDRDTGEMRVTITYDLPFGFSVVTPEIDSIDFCAGDWTNELYDFPIYSIEELNCGLGDVYPVESCGIIDVFPYDCLGFDVDPGCGGYPGGDVTISGGGIP